MTNESADGRAADEAKRQVKQGWRAGARAIFEFATVMLCTVAFVFTIIGVGVGILGSTAPGTRDFVEYWASGQQLVHHANPYDGAALLPLERSVGLPSGIPPMVMGNAPPALLLVFPLGFVGARAGELLWTLLLVWALVGSVSMVQAMHGRPKNQVQWLGYSFGPALICLAAGQSALLVLLGVVLYLYLHRERPFLAGASLWFCALKPQLFLPFGLVLLVWAVTTKRYRLLSGAAVALLLSTLAAYVLDPQAWGQYSRMMSEARYDKLPIPCLSIVLRTTISPDSMWLQYVPAAVGCVWALAYFLKHREDWDWTVHGSPLLLVSLLTAPYTWLMDQTVAIPALLHGAYVTRSRMPIALLALATAAIELSHTPGGLSLLTSPFYLWTSPAWLGWYLWATRSDGAKSVAILAPATQVPISTPS